MRCMALDTTKKDMTHVLPHLAMTKVLSTESIVASGVYGLILVVLITGIVLAFRHKPTSGAAPAKPTWEESLNKRA